jgi:capsular polysaccharide biosynthesis protein
MNTSEAPRANGSDGFSSAPSPLPESDPFFIGDRITAKSPRIRSRSVLRRLARRWLHILLLWLIISSLIVALIHASIKPTHVATSLLEIEPVQDDIFGPVQRHNDETRSLTYLQTQVQLITSNKILEPALTSALVINLPTIKRFDDPRYDLRKKLTAEIIGDTNLIRIALELPDRGEAVQIVNAIAQAYLAQSVDYGRMINRKQTDSYEEQLEIISKLTQSKKQTLKDFIKQRKSVATNPGEMLNPKAETDPTQPTLNKVTKEQFAILFDKQVQCDLEYLDAVSLLEAVKAIRQRNEDKRLTNGDTGPLSEARIRDLEVAVEKARTKKESFARQFGKIQVIDVETDDDIAESKHLNSQLESLMQWEGQVRNNLEQLKYEAAHERYRVRLIDEASASRSPVSDRALESMAVAPMAVLFLLIGSFLAYEIRAGRKAATLPE